MLVNKLFFDLVVVIIVGIVGKVGNDILYVLLFGLEILKFELDIIVLLVLIVFLII